METGEQSLDLGVNVTTNVKKGHRQLRNIAISANFLECYGIHSDYGQTMIYVRTETARGTARKQSSRISGR